MQSVADVQDRASSSFSSPALVPSGLGTETFDHFVPFQCRIWFRRVALAASGPSVPTAQQILAEAHRMLCSMLASSAWFPPGFGTLACVQRSPFQCSIRLRVTPAGPVPTSYWPVAQQSAAEVHATSDRLLKSLIFFPP